MFKKVICILLLLCNSVLFSQEPIHYFLGKDIFNGVQLYSIIQDTDNSMWIASNKGMFYYDGINFKEIPVKESERDAFFGLTKDNENNIYFFNFSGQVFKITHKKITLFYTVPQNFLGVNLNINCDNLNNLHITSSGNLIKVNRTTKKTVFYSGRGFHIAKKNDTLFYGKHFKNNTFAIVKAFNNQETIVKKLPVKIDRKIGTYAKLIFHNNNLYTFSAKENELYLINNKNVKALPLPLSVSLSKKNYYDFYYSSNNFWFTDIKNGVHKISPEAIKPNIFIKKWFNKYRISHVYTDFENNTWLLTFDNGIIVIPNLNVSNFKINDEKIAQVKKIDNKIYISTKESNIYNFKNGKFTPFFKGKEDRFESFNIFKNKNIITSSTSVYKGNKQLKNNIIFNRGTVLLNDSIFVALHAGLLKFDIQNNKTAQLDRRRTYDVCLSEKKDKIYISTIKGMLSYDFKNFSAINFNNKPFQSRKLTPINDEIWVSSKNGIYIIKENDSVKKITTKDGLLSNNVEKIKYEHPFVYITNAKGFQKYNLETNTFNNLVEDYGLTKSIKNFEVLNDTIYATTTNGLAVFSFNDAKPKMAEYHTNITEAIANGTKVFSNKTSLEPNENNVSFSFLTTSHRYQKKLDYYYQLIGYDKEPIKTKEGQYVVNYSNLPAGNYTFKVQSTIYDLKNYPATIQFSIQQHWYKTTWFRMLAIFTIVLMLYTIYRGRIKAIERKRKEEKFKKNLAESSLTSLKAQMNPHFMFNAMNSVQSLILKGKKDDAYSYLTKLSQLIRETLNMSEKTWVYLDEEIEQLTNYLELEKLRFPKDFSFTITNDESLYEFRIPSMIIQPFVENSVKHGLLHKEENKAISIVFQLHEKSLLCIVEDNGIGREASKKINQKKPDYYESFSTNTIQKRFKLYKKYLNEDVGFVYEDLVDEQQNSTGTRVTITIPYRTDED